MAEGEALREVFVRFAAEVEGEEELEHVGHAADEAKEHVKEVGEHAEHAEGTFKRLGEALEGVTAFFAGAELLKGIGETAEGLEQLAHLSEQTGVATQQLEFYGFVVGQVGGDVADFRSNLSALQRGLSATESAMAPQTAALKKLGIETKNADGSSRAMNEVLPEIFANFGNLKNENEEAAVATRLFGKSGLALLPVLREGAKGFEEYQKQFEAAGGATPQESIERAQEYVRALKRMQAVFEDLKTHLVTGVLPALTHVVEDVTAFVANMGHFLKGTTAASHAALALGAALAGPLMRALKPLLGPGLKFLAIYAAVDDVLAFLEGKDSLIGRALNGVFGDGTADKVRAWVLDAKNALGDFAGSAQATFEAMASDQSSFTEKALASFVAFVRDAGAGFPALTASLSMQLDLMAAAIETFVADALEKLSGITKVMAAAAPLIIPGPAGIAAGAALSKVASVDTTGIRNAAAENRSAAADRGAEVEAILRGVRSNAFGGAAGGTAARQAIADQIAAGPVARTAVVPSSKEQIEQGRAAEQFATLGAAHAAGVTATLNDNKQITLNFKEGASEDLKRQVKQAVAEALKDDNRVALQQITQRGSK